MSQYVPPLFQIPLHITMYLQVKLDIRVRPGTHTFRPRSQQLVPIFPHFRLLTLTLTQINPGPLIRWQWGQNHSASYPSAVQNMTTFKTWWSTAGYGRPSESSCSQGIFVYPSYLGTPSYRNTYFDAPTTPPLGWSTGRAAVFGGGAELVVPVGEVSYESTISLQTEYLPVGVNLLVAPGCDLVLANLVKELEQEGILRASRAGSRI